MNIREKTLAVLDKLLEEGEFCGYSTSLNLSAKNFETEGISSQDVLKVFVRLYSSGCWQLDRYAPDEDYDYLWGKKPPPEDKIFSFDFISYLKIYRLRRELLNEVGSSIISKDALTVISKEIAWNEDAEKIEKKLLESGVGKNLIDHMPGKAVEMVNELFIYLATSKKQSDQNLLFQLIGEFSHPLHNKNDFDLAQYKADEFSRALQYDGLCVNNWKVEKITPKIIEELRRRCEERAERNGEIVRSDYFSDDVVEFPHQINFHPTEHSKKTIKNADQYTTEEDGLISYFDLCIDKINKEIWQKDNPEKKLSFVLKNTDDSITYNQVFLDIHSQKGEWFNDKCIFDRLPKNETGNKFSKKVKTFEELHKALQQSVIYKKCRISTHKRPDKYKWLEIDKSLGIRLLDDFNQN